MQKLKAKKVDMTQIFDESGVVFPVTRLMRENKDGVKEEGALELADGDIVVVSGISKGKGFQGVVKRHGFAGGRRTHGQKHSEREPGSIGIGGVQKVFKGKRMGGRMGSDRVTVKNLTVIKVVPESGEIYIRGAIPGRRGTMIEIRSTKS
jgi:large subunit ribosomal protein L3